MSIADRIADPDLHCLGLTYQGHIQIAQGDVRTAFRSTMRPGRPCSRDAQASG